MALYTESHGHHTWSPLPKAGSRNPTKLGELLGNFQQIYNQFPELSSGGQHLPLMEFSRQDSITYSSTKETFKDDDPSSTNHLPTSLLSHSIWESSTITFAHSTPKLGRLDKLEKLGLLHTCGSKASPPELSKNSTNRGPDGPKAHFQRPLHISSRSARLQREHGLSIHKLDCQDTSSTLAEPESPVDADDGSANDLVSKATTPATSLDFTFDLQAKIDVIVNNAATHGTSQDITFTVPAGSWPGANSAHNLQGPILPGLSLSGPPPSSSNFAERAQRYRSSIFALVATHFGLLRPGQATSLPWDEHGNYTVVESPSQQKVGISYGFKSAFVIEPHYRVDKATQLGIVKARLAQMDFKHQLELGLENSTAAQAAMSVRVVHPALLNGRSTQPIHVFVDMSNIVIGFYDYMRQERNLAAQQRIQASFFFEALATILERERPCMKRIVAGSMGPGAPWEAHMFEAQSAGYTMHILQRVKGPKPSRTMAPTTSSPSLLSPQNGWNVHHEQGVDELLQLHMLQSIVDTPTPFSESGEPLCPGTMVLATGDGAEAEFSDGFFNHVLRALKHGWCVEVVGFQHNMNQLWDEQAIPAVWRARFRLVFLDEFAEELLASFR